MEGNCHAPSNAGVKRKRVVLSLKDKLDIINRLDQGEKVANLANEYNVGKSSVMDIKTSKETILKFVSSFENVDNINKRKTMKCAYNKELDKAVYNWYLNMKQNGQTLPGSVICEKALELNTALGGSPDFKASGGWLNNFKYRHGLDFPVNGDSSVPSITRANADETLKLACSDKGKPSSERLQFPRTKRKHVVLSLQQKLDIINRLDSGEMASSLAREYNVGKSTVKDIRTNQDAILNYVSSFVSPDHMQRRKTMKCAYNKDLDQAVYKWYIQMLENGCPMSGPQICDKALELNKLYGGSSDFKASSGWLQNFKSRHGVQLQVNENSTNPSSLNYSYTSAEDLYPDIYYDSKANLSPQYEHGNSDQSGNPLFNCDVILKVSDESYQSDRTESESCDLSKSVSSQLLTAFDSIITWARQQDECTTSDIANLSKLRDLAQVKEMSVAFSSDGSEVINRRIEHSEYEQRDDSFSIEDMYEIKRCGEWIKTKDFSKVALQFPDSLLGDATAVALKLQDITDRHIFVLGDTSFGSCCVDEIAAEHVSADAIIHFGHACLSPTRRLPVLFVFGKLKIDIQDTKDAFRKLFPDRKSYVLILYEVMYVYSIGDLSELLKDYENVIISKLDIPQEENNSCTLDIKSNSIPFTKCHRHIDIPEYHKLNKYSVFYIGSRAVTITNLMFSLKDCPFYSYNPVLKLFRAETLDVNKHLKRRYYYIEKAKDANIIGILVGTLGVANYLDIIKHLKELIKQAGKKSYTLVVGKLNDAKLANFSEIQVFVNVACVESSLIESREFYQSIVTPYELEIALNQARNWTGDYITDFREILPGAANYVPFYPNQNDESDVSLITGNIRSAGISSTKTAEIDSENSIIARDDMEVSTIHNHGAGKFLAQRSWQGMEQKLGETPVCKVEEGLHGIASKYESENVKEDM